MKSIIKGLLLVGVICASCQKDVNHLDDDVSLLTVGISQDSARTEFAKILSKAVYNEHGLRHFIKSVAMDEFDNDYDVFYPFVKDQVVNEGKTFRQILEKHSENPEILLKIEEALPLLNIYVPDLTAFFAFNAEHWNAEEREIAVTALNHNNDPHVFYGNGERMFALEKNEIPGFPCLVVKNNERVKLKNNIKLKSVASQDAYEFIHPAFDKKLNTKASLATSSQNSPMIENAWSEFGVDARYWQRDYIYYGLSHSNPKNGTLNPQIREHIEMIKFEPSILSIISDQAGDPSLKNSHEHKSDTRDPLTFDQISRALWTDGRFEFHITVSKGRRDGVSVVPQLLIVNVHPTEIFHFKRIKHAIKGGGWFHRDKHTYSIESINDIISKPYFPKNAAGYGLPIDKWDVGEESMNLNFRISERDDGQVIENFYSTKNTYANSSNFTYGLVNEVTSLLKLNLGFGSTTNQSTEKIETTKIVTTKNSDDLGSATLYFSDPILRNRSTKMQVGDSPLYFADAYAITTGLVTMQVIPKKL